VPCEAPSSSSGTIRTCLWFLLVLLLVCYFISL
jgi:hypothetical protein